MAIRGLLVAVLLLASIAVWGGDRDLVGILKKSNPESLGLFLLSDDDECPKTKEQYQSIVEGVFIRSRLKATPPPLDGTHLNVNVMCMQRKNNNPVYYITVEWVDWSGGKRGEIVTYNAGGLEVIGIGTSEDIDNTIKEKTEKALTDYIKINWNL